MNTEIVKTEIIMRQAPAMYHSVSECAGLSAMSDNAKNRKMIDTTDNTPSMAVIVAANLSLLIRDFGIGTIANNKNAG